MQSKLFPDNFKAQPKDDPKTKAVDPDRFVLTAKERLHIYKKLSDMCDLVARKRKAPEYKVIDQLVNDIEEIIQNEG